VSKRIRTYGAMEMMEQIRCNPRPTKVLIPTTDLHLRSSVGSRIVGIGKAVDGGLDGRVQRPVRFSGIGRLDQTDTPIDDQAMLSCRRKPDRSGVALSPLTAQLAEDAAEKIVEWVRK
jgi:hypothetical protein